MNIQLEINHTHFIISQTLEFGVNNGCGGMLPDPYLPASGLRYSFPQLLGVLINDNINQLYHPPKPGPLLTQGHPHCLSTVWVQRLIRKARPLASILDHPKEPSLYHSFL